MHSLLTLWDIKEKFRFQLIPSKINLTVPKLQRRLDLKKVSLKGTNLVKSVQSNIYFFIFCHSHEKLLCLKKVMGWKTSCVVCPVNEVTLVVVLEKLIILCYCAAVIFPSFLHSVFACFLYLSTTEKLQIYPPSPNICLPLYKHIKNVTKILQ